MGSIKIKGATSGSMVLTVPDTGSDNVPVNVDSLLEKTGDGSGLSGVGTGKNLIINGGFDVWQRGTTGSGSYVFVADRFQNIRIGSRKPTDGSRGCIIDCSMSSGNWQHWNTKVEAIDNQFNGKTLTLSFWAKTVESTNDFTFHIDGSAGFSLSVSVTSSWQKFTTTKTIGNLTGGLLDIRWYVNSSGTTSNEKVQIKDIQLEEGSVATNFDYRSYGEELALCQRYYQTYGDSYHSGMVYNSSIITSSLIVLPVAMRTNPTVDWSSPHHITEANNWGVYGAHNGWSNVGYPPTAQNVSAGAFRIQIASLVGVSNGMSYLLDGGFALDAEL